MLLFCSTGGLAKMVRESDDYLAALESLTVHENSDVAHKAQLLLQHIKVSTQ